MTCSNEHFFLIKSQCFSRPLLERDYMRGSILIENILFSRNCDIEIKNTKSITDASIWVVFISKNSNTLEKAEHSLFNSPGELSFAALDSFQVN